MNIDAAGVGSNGTRIMLNAIRHRFSVARSPTEAVEAIGSGWALRLGRPFVSSEEWWEIVLPVKVNLDFDQSGVSYVINLKAHNPRRFRLPMK
uniref:Uncharacterized protein n=1 Tax=Anopheles atroparvus TaxID=41427 RepID=A0AAG5D2E7_ANOAO